MDTVRKGSRGETVRLLQEILNILGCECGKTDGKFGKNTLSVLKRFQADNGLKVDGIAGPLTWAALMTSSGAEKPPSPEGEGFPHAGGKAQPPDFKQYDPRWAGKMYSSHGDRTQTMKSSGCGPTAMADVVAALIDNSVTPPLLADRALAWGDRSHSSGTAWSFFRHVSEAYPFGRYLKTGSREELLNCLDSGGLAVASMGKGYWTKGGHYICVWKHDGTFIYANDPASSKRTRQKISDFMKERKAFFCFWKEGE